MIRSLINIVRNRISKVAVAAIAVIATAGTASAQVNNPYSSGSYGAAPYGQADYGTYGQHHYPQAGYGQPSYGQPVFDGGAAVPVTREQIDAEIQQIMIQARTAPTQELEAGMLQVNGMMMQIQAARMQLQGPTDPQIQQVELAEYALNRLAAVIQQELANRQNGQSPAPTPAPYNGGTTGGWQPAPQPASQTTGGWQATPQTTGVSTPSVSKKNQPIPHSAREARSPRTGHSAFSITAAVRRAPAAPAPGSSR